MSQRFTQSDTNPVTLPAPVVEQSLLGVNDIPQSGDMMELAQLLDLATADLDRADSEHLDGQDVADAREAIMAARRQLSAGNGRLPPREVRNLAGRVRDAVKDLESAIQQHELDEHGYTTKKAAQIAAMQDEAAAHKTSAVGPIVYAVKRPFVKVAVALGVIQDDEPTEAELVAARKERVGMHAAQRRQHAGKRMFGMGGEHEGVGAGLLRASRSAASSTRGKVNSLANDIGFLEEHGLNTAQDLEAQAAGARTEEEYEYVRGQRIDAYARRFAGKTFVGQEIDDALAALSNSRVGKQIVSEKIGSSWGLRGLNTSDVVARLQANGYITGDRAWNPFAHEANAQWSDAAIQKIDRNGDGQLSAGEIGYAMAHKYGVSAGAAPKSSIASDVRDLLGQVQGKGWEKLVWTDKKGQEWQLFKHDEKQIIGTLQQNGIKLDRNDDGHVSGTELSQAMAQLRDKLGAHQPGQSGHGVSPHPTPQAKPKSAPQKAH